MKFYICGFFENLLERFKCFNVNFRLLKCIYVDLLVCYLNNLLVKFKFHYNRTRMMATLHEDQYTFLIISRAVILRMKNVSDKCRRKNQKAHFMFKHFFSKIVPFMRYGKVLQATDDNMAHAHCMLCT